MNIVIPTYENHLTYNINFLNSFKKYCNDKEYVTINFICCNYNKNIFLELKENFNDLNINIFTLSQLIKKVDHIDFDDSPNNFNTKYPLQSLKKILSFSVVDSDYLVLDSENLCIKDFYFREVIDIIKNKKIKYTIKNYINNPFELLIIDNCNKLINFNNNSFSFLDPYWYFEKDIVLKLMTELVETHQNKIIFILKDILFFEYQLYSTFCFKHNLKQKISTDEILIDEKVLKNNLNDEKYNPLGHTYHYICSTITDETIDSYIKLLNNLDERITRLHWMPEKLANKIIEHTKVSIGTLI